MFSLCRRFVKAAQGLDVKLLSVNLFKRDANFRAFENCDNLSVFISVLSKRGFIKGVAESVNVVRYLKMLFYKQCLGILIIVIVTRETLQKDEIKGKSDEKMKHKTQRRFIEDLDDKEWHISHLRDMEFDTEVDCEEETFEEKAKKYRETLKNDAALVEYVSGDAIHVDKQNLTKGKCKKNISNIFKTKEKITKSTLNVTHIKKGEEMNSTSLDGEVKTATVSPKLDEREKIVSRITNSRRSEYQFSSAEYYDEVPDFDHSICPDTVDVITLELDQLRNYDVECEAILEWRSLE
ncbi:unnamed protein product [Euphydryas editha]|uniref:Uncharacterized protein n=1 Tax=Euphydryas editha TaxID=104508 RepID=A0AAU9UM08_EUPED|nr:unnamed protein product [Euphydryas editha]